MSRRTRMQRTGGGVLGTLAVVLVAVVGVLSGGAAALDAENPLEPLDTSSPRATYLSFVDQVVLLEDLLLAYKQDRSAANQSAFDSALSKVEVLFDFSDVAEANRTEAIGQSFASLADILNRIPAPEISEIPDADDVEQARATEELTLPGTDVPILRAGSGVTDYRLPGTEITITRISEGPRAGEYVFSAATVAELPDWRTEVDGIPVDDDVRVTDWVQEDAEFTGHLVPRRLVNALPGTFDSDFLGSPLWKLVVDAVILGLIGVMIVAWHRWVRRRGTPGTVGAYLIRLTTPALLLVALEVVRGFMDAQVNHSGDVATIANLIVTTAIWASLSWGFWLLTRLVAEWIISGPAIRNESLDAHLLRLLAKVVSVVGAFVLGCIGLSRLGVPTVGLGIGAGVAGVAVALAATNTLENLLGGITVYADRPFRVGDKISVGDDFGTVEEIGPRSTRLRRLDDTRVTLPNADISRAKITNFTARRYTLFVHVVGVRYETTADQLRTIVDAIDRRFRDHPMVLDEADFPRVRVSGFGSSSIDIEVRAHVDTDDLGVFTGVQEELLLLVHEIVEAAGSGFAFPSTTTYLAEDAGLPARVPSLTVPDTTGADDLGALERRA